MTAKEKKLYQPRIKNERIRQLYALKQEVHKPMTVLIEEALVKYLEDIKPRKVIDYLNGGC